MMGRNRHDATRTVLLFALLLGVGGTSLGASLNEGIIEFRKGEVEQALAVFGALAADDPGNLAALFWLGRAQLEAGRHEAAVTSLTRVLREMPDSTDARYWLGVAHLRWGRAGEARAQFEAVLKQDPQHEGAREALGRLPETVTATTPAAAGGPHGARVAVNPGGLRVSLGEVDLLSANLLDYTFSDAPTDWFARSGVWAITNRWTCSPQWSWQGGFATDGVAALWNKREFVGDVTVEGYFAFQMGVAGGRSYKNPTDLNITIHGDGANPGSGYSFMVGAQGNTETRIMRGTEVLAASADPKALLPVFEDGYPSTYDFHRKWWSVRARKHGGKLELYLDERLVVEAEDPNPLPMGRVALWTYDNGIVISRVKIYHEGEQSERHSVPGEDQVRPSHTTVAERAFTLTSASHPAVRHDFEADAATWRPRDERHPVVLRIVEPGAGGLGRALAVTNTISGGAFGATIIPGSFVVDDLPKLSFDYRLPADENVKVNLYLQVGEEVYEIAFSGPPHGTPQATQLGAIRDVVADGRWQHAEFDLLGALRAAGVADRKITAKDLWIGNLCDDDYLLAGFGGNHLGATYHLDNFTLDRPGGSRIEVAFRPAKGTEITGWGVALDNVSHAEAPRAVTTEQPSAELTADGGGVWHVHARGKLADGSWTPTETFRVRVDETPPAVADISPAPGSVLPDGPITMRLVEAGGSGIDAASIKPAVDGKEVPVDGATAAYDPVTGVLALDPRLVPARPEDGREVKVALAPLKDRAGNAMAGPKEWSYRLDFSQDSTPPPPPVVYAGKEGPIYEDFEHSMGAFTTYGGAGGARLALDDSTAASGERSLRVHNPEEGGRFGIIRRGAFDAGRYRIVRFDYKVPPRLRADIAVYVNGTMKGIRFKDTDNNLPIIGAVPDVKDDNRWHTAEFNLYDMLRKDDPTAAGYVVDQFVIADWNWRSNVKGQRYHLDSFQLIPVVSAAEGLPLSWRAPDISGILGLGWLLGEDPDKQAPQQVMLEGTSGVLADVGNHDGWLHARVQDGAGNWSETASARLLVDTTRPVAEPLSPADGAAAATSAVELKLVDEGISGIDPASVVLSVAGVDYGVKSRGMGGLHYDSAAGKLVWNCEQVLPRPVVLPDKKPVEVALKAAKDYAGNPVRTLPRWSWTMDYSRDETPPVIGELRSATHRTFLTNTFEDGLDGWANTGGAQGAAVELDTTTAASGEASVKLTQQTAGGRMSAIITREPFQADVHSVISFSYKVPANVKLDLVVRMAAGTEYAVSFTDNPTGALARIPNVRADNTWRHVSFELEPIVRRRQARGSLDVALLYWTDRNTMDNPKGATAWFDNFVIGTVGTRAPVLRWKATDTTGIAGYSYALDQQPGTVPPEEVAATSQSYRHEGTLDKGRWYFHLRAVDGAGNWGPTTHYALMHLTPD